MTAIEQPQVSIIIASYNHGPFVEEAIRSVLRQSYRNIQLIVIDDASPDDSASRIERLQSEGNNFLFLRNPENIGLQRSLERAIGEVTGEYLAWFASDDFILEDKIERQVAFLRQHELDGVYSSGYVLQEDGRKIPMDMARVEEMFKAGTYLNHIYVCDTYGAMFQSGLFRAEALRSLAYIRQSFWSDDWAVAIKLLENYRIGFLNIPAVVYRLHADNTYKKYWGSLPGRVQVVSLLTPLALRHVALSNVLAAHADHLRADGHHRLAFRFCLAALAIDFSLTRLKKSLVASCYPLVGFLSRRVLILRGRKKSPTP